MPFSYIQSTAYYISVCACLQMNSIYIDNIILLVYSVMAGEEALFSLTIKQS